MFVLVSLDDLHFCFLHLSINIFECFDCTVLLFMHVIVGFSLPPGAPPPLIPRYVFIFNTYAYCLRFVIYNNQTTIRKKRKLLFIILFFPLFLVVYFNNYLIPTGFFLFNLFI